MVVKHYYNIGMAVGRDEKGLIVPNLKDCDRKNLVQLAAEVNDLAARARADRLKPDEIQGGTFSITNAGVYGAINSSPVINVPEVAILGVHKIVERAGGARRPDRGAADDERLDRLRSPRGRRRAGGQVPAPRLRAARAARAALVLRVNARL